MQSPPPDTLWDFKEIVKTIETAVVTYGMDIIGALLIFIIGRYIAKGLTKIVHQSMKKAKVDATLVSFTKNLIYMGAMAFVIIACLDRLGVQSTSMIVVIGAAGLAIALAVQGTLANFASGFIIIIFRPFKVGDLIEVDGNLGVVRDIEIFTTKITTLDHKTVILPNGSVTSLKITNFTETDKLRMDLVFTASYRCDIDKVKKICMDIMLEDERILTDPAPFTGLLEHGTTGLNYAVRPYVLAKDYWDVYFDMQEKVKKGFDAHGICIPFPQQHDLDNNTSRAQQKTNAIADNPN